MKMACLSYEPSKIIYKSKIYTRYELLDLRQSIIRDMSDLYDEMKQRIKDNNYNTDKKNMESLRCVESDTAIL